MRTLHHTYGCRSSTDRCAWRLGGLLAADFVVLRGALPGTYDESLYVPAMPVTPEPEPDASAGLPCGLEDSSDAAETEPEDLFRYTGSNIRLLVDTIGKWVGEEGTKGV